MRVECKIPLGGVWYEESTLPFGIQITRNVMVRNMDV
jgi:hypothetical protein